MTWNLQCACWHVTGFRKGLVLEEDRYTGRWTEARSGARPAMGRDGITPRALAGHRGGQADRPARQGRGSHRRDLRSCHSRRAQVAEGFVPRLRGAPPGQTFLDFYDPSLPTNPRITRTGRSARRTTSGPPFRQSRMHAKGVGCTDCHDPHTAKVRRLGNALCLGLPEVPGAPPVRPGRRARHTRRLEGRNRRTGARPPHEA